jgi:hypothetical protein
MSGPTKPVSAPLLVTADDIPWGLAPASDDDTAEDLTTSDDLLTDSLIATDAYRCGFLAAIHCLHGLNREIAEEQERCRRLREQHDRDRADLRRQREQHDGVVAENVSPRAQHLRRTK